MEKLFDLTKKSEKYVIGLMSGTSVDAVDAALVKLVKNGIDTKIDLIGFIEYPIPAEIKEMILNNSAKESASIEDICRLNFIIPQIYKKAVDSLLDKLGFAAEDVDLIGSHGQTIHHLPDKKNVYGFNGASTLQIGDPSVLAKLTGIVTVGDFRTGDIALGGQGAPLVPYFDYIIFRSYTRNRALLNIGGISNFTILEKNSMAEDVIAFDTGPGNMLIDLAAKRFFDIPFDSEGEIAAAGKFNEDLFNTLAVKDNFIESPPPKSTGREYYGVTFIEDCFEEFKNLSGEDWLNTLTHFTAYGIFRNYEKFVAPKIIIDELILSGGGAKNKYLLKLLQEKFGEIDLKVIDEIGLSSDAKEAVCFAVLANETISGNPSNMPGATGAKRATILGKICLP